MEVVEVGWSPRSVGSWREGRKEGRRRKKVTRWMGTKRGSEVGTRWTWRRTRGMSTSDIEKSHRGGGGGNEMNVEDEGDREGSDVSHPRDPRFAREEREGIGG